MCRGIQRGWQGKINPLSKVTVNRFPEALPLKMGLSHSHVGFLQGIHYTSLRIDFVVGVCVCVNVLLAQREATCRAFPYTVLAMNHILI